MKKVTTFIKGLKAELQAAETPTVKKQLIEDAKALASEILSGFWLTIAELVLTELESTIAA